MANSGSFVLDITGISPSEYLSSTAGYDDLYFSWYLSNVATGEITWSLYLRSGVYGAINSSTNKALSVTIDNVAHSYSVNVGISSNTQKLLASGVQTIGYDANNQKTFTVSISLSLNITWHPHQGNQFHIGIRSGSSDFTIVNTSDQSQPPSGNYAGIVRDTAPVTAEFTINLSSFGKDVNGSTASIQYGGRSYIRISRGNDEVTINYTSISLNTNVTTLFYSLTPNATYTVEFHIETDASDGNNVFSGLQILNTKNITAPTTPNSVLISYNTAEPEAESIYTLSWANPTNTGYSGGTEVTGTYNVMRFVIQNIYCNGVSLLSSNNQSTYDWNNNSNYMSLRLEQSSNDLNFYWESDTTPFYTKTDYNFPDDGILYFSIAAQRIYRDRFGSLSASPLDANLVFVNSNSVGPIQDQAKIFVLVGNEWKRGKVFVKVGNDWKKAKKVFSKVNDRWIRQNNS